MGSNTIDAFVKTDAKVVHLHYKLKRKKGFVDKDKLSLAYPVGEKILINHLDFQTGGGGTNTAAAFSLLGFRTGYIGKIGRDDNGLKIYKFLKEYKIEFLGSLGDITGYSVILDSMHEDRTILAFKGCNDNLKFEDIDLKRVNSKWIYFSSMMGESLESVKKLAGYASKKKIKVAFNPSIYLTEKGHNHIKSVLDATSILLMNMDEATSLSGEENITDSLLSLKKYAKDYVVITDGSKGAWCFDGKNIYFGAPRKGLKIVETTGAGDAFASAFVAMIIKGKTPDIALKAGMLQAESVIQSYGAKNDLLSIEELDKHLSSDKRKISVMPLQGKKKKHSKKAVHNKKAAKKTVKKAKKKETKKRELHAKKDFVIPEHHSFILLDGKKIDSLSQLLSHLKKMNERVFSHHVTPEKNDFATWIKDVFHEEDLSGRVMLADTKENIISELSDFLKNKNKRR